MAHLQPSTLRVLNAVTSHPDGEHTLDVRRKLGAQFPGIRVKFVRTALIRLWKRGLVKWDGREHWRLSRKGTQLCVYGLAAAGYHSGGYVRNAHRAIPSVMQQGYPIASADYERARESFERMWPYDNFNKTVATVTVEATSQATPEALKRRRDEICADIRRAFLVPGHMLGRDKA